MPLAHGAEAHGEADGARRDAVLAEALRSKTEAKIDQIAVQCVNSMFARQWLLAGAEPKEIRYGAMSN